MSAPTRRGLLGGAAVLATASAVAKSEPDVIRNPDGTWPISLFPPGQHPRADWQPGSSVPDEPDDADLIAACAAFCQAQADFDVANAESGWSDAEINRLSERWTAALNAVLASPSPTTPSGRIALAQAAQIALVIAVRDLGPDGWEANATPEHRMILMALSGVVGSAEA